MLSLRGKSPCGGPMIVRQLCLVPCPSNTVRGAKRLNRAGGYLIETHPVSRRNLHNSRRQQQEQFNANSGDGSDNGDNSSDHLFREPHAQKKQPLQSLHHELQTVLSSRKRRLGAPYAARKHLEQGMFSTKGRHFGTMDATYPTRLRRVRGMHAAQEVYL